MQISEEQDYCWHKALRSKRSLGSQDEFQGLQSHEKYLHVPDAQNNTFMDKLKNEGHTSSRSSNWRAKSSAMIRKVNSMSIFPFRV